MPLSPPPPPPPNPVGVSNRRAAPTNQASSVTNTKWPLLASTAYTKLARAGTTAGDTELAGLNKMLVRLAHARNRLHSTLVAYDAAIKEVNPQVKGGTPHAGVYNKLRADRDRVEKLWKEFPLEVRG